MKLDYEDLAGGVRKIVLAGRMDIAGTNAVDLRFSALAGAHHGGVVVDLSGIEFLASLGLATLVKNAKALKNRNARMVLLNPSPPVATVLEATGIGDVVDVCGDLDAAVAAARAGVPAAK
jgi:anti-anti-sigma factor